MNQRILAERANDRAMALKHSDPNFGSKIFEALQYASNEFESLALETGFLLSEKVNPLTIEKAIEFLKSDPEFENLEDSDIRDFAKYFLDQGAGSLLFAPDVMSNFISFSKRVGFPVTLGGAERGGLNAPRYDTKTLLRVLIGAHVLTVSEVPAVDAQDAKHSAPEDVEFRDNPKKKVDIYEYDLGFLREVGYVLRTVGVKEECINQKSFKSLITEKKEAEMKPALKLEDLEKKISQLSISLNEAEEESEEDESTDQESEMFKEMDDDTVERFVDGMLIVLGELEQTGALPRIERPEQARDAILAAVRRLYQKRSLISKMSKKFARFGSKRVLRKARQEISKALD